MDTPIFARIPLSIEGHPFDALSAGERRLLARIESQTLARIAACAHYADVRRRNVVPGHDALMEDRGDSAGCRLAASAQDFAGFVLERGPWAVRVFLDWMGVAAADVEAFFAMSGCRAHREGIERTLLARYRGRFLASPQRDPRFARRLAALTTRAQLARIEAEIR